MTPERWKKLDELFHEAIALQGEARASHLARACGDDRQMREEAERLIAAHEREGSFIDSPILAEVMTRTNDRHESLVGRSIGPYKVVGLLGRGGMGEVYRALDPRLGREVAIKLLPTAFSTDQDRLRRFEQEARAAGMLNHPNILTIYDIGRHDSAPYIVSELLAGETLRERLRRGPLPLRLALDYALQIVRGLAATHEKGIVHRDLKPENLFVASDGRVKILDFGLAKLTERPAATAEDDSAAEEPTWVSTKSGLVMGTVNYMSPEQARGQKVDHRTDIFNMGVMLYEMVARRRPFEGATMSDVIAALLTSEPPALRSINPLVPAGLEQLTAKCLAKDREARYQSAAELLEDLKRIERELMPGTAATAVERPKTDSSRSAWRMPFISVLAALAAAAIIYALFFRHRPATPQHLAAEVRTLAVLPLKSLNGEAGDDYLGLGIADAIITRTSQMKTLVVRPISAVHGYHNQKVDPLEVARGLQVDAVLDGSVQRVGEHLRVSLNLLRARDGASLWADTLDREMKNAFALQDDVSLNVVKALKLTLTASEEKQLARPPTNNATAYDYFLRGRFYMTRESGKTDYEMAISLFESAIAHDPSFALAHANLAGAASAIFFSHDADRKYEEKAYVSLEKALALNPGLAEAYTMRANLIWTLANGFPHRRAIEDHRRALAINPNLAVAHRIFGALIVHLGLLDQAREELMTALRLEPNDHGAPPRIARIYWYQQKYDLALAEFQKANSPAFAWEMALTLWHLGRKAEAFALVEKRLSQPTGHNIYDFHAVYAVLLADAGRRREAESHIRLAIEGGQGISHFHHAEFSIACAYALMGERQRALEWLENTAEHGMPCYPLFNTEPALDSLRGHPQFRVFMEKMKKQWEAHLRDFG